MSHNSNLVFDKISTRLPVSHGEFQLHLYRDFDGKDHLALEMGDVYGMENVFVRVHSECLTGDIFGSARCDCGEQLRQSIHIITEEGLGVIIYLRQEGRGIGLRNKLHAYNLQDEGYDTTEANLKLGHAPDERNYSLAAFILRDLGVKSVRLLSNNPEKLKSLTNSGTRITSRIPLNPRITPENAFYLKTKVSRMNHILDLDELSPTSPERDNIIRYITRKMKSLRCNRPFVTLSYAQSLDGYISASLDKPISLSGRESLILTHKIRSIHDAILVGIGTVLSDNPQLSVRLVKGENPQPIILDTRLRFPVDAKLLNTSVLPWIITGRKSKKKKQRILEGLGAKVFRLPANNNGVELPILLSRLAKKNIRSIMVEGGTRVISSFIDERLVDLFVLTITPFIIGSGLQAFEQKIFDSWDKMFSLRDLRYVKIGRDLIVCGIPSWDNDK